MSKIQFVYLQYTHTHTLHIAESYVTVTHSLTDVTPPLPSVFPCICKYIANHSIVVIITCCCSYYLHFGITSIILIISTMCATCLAVYREHVSPDSGDEAHVSRGGAVTMTIIYSLSTGVG